MNNISIEKLEQKIEVGEEVSDTYFAPDTTRIGKTEEGKRQQATGKSLNGCYR